METTEQIRFITKGTKLKNRTITLLLFWLLAPSLLWAQSSYQPIPTTWPELGNNELERYFENHVAAMENPMAGIKTLEQWEKARPRLHQELLEMLGLDPMPDRTPLHATVTGIIDRDNLDFTVENIHFQSRPGLYVTGNLYMPKKREGKIPAVLYVCGHAKVRIDGVNYGSKAAYQHHGAWFARNGYACLMIDTLQLGEIEGIHHGTYNRDRWWWISRGYTSAGVEAWNSVRALDYLESRPEIDAEKLGVTGRSGGGAYSWWISAIDERIKCAVPVAGITSLRNHVIDGTIEGHCDCMFQVNTYGWDYSQIAAMVAPRPLLISNTDNDRIFPLGGVVDVYNEAHQIYQLHGGAKTLGLNIVEGPHSDTQPLRTAAFHWFNRHFKNTELKDTYQMAATKMFEPHELKVFDKLPEDEINTRVDEVFVPRATTPEAPVTPNQRESWMTALKTKSFLNWTSDSTPPKLRSTYTGSYQGLRLDAFDLVTETNVTCQLYLVYRDGQKLTDLDHVMLNVLDQKEWNDLLHDIPKSFAEAFPDVDLPRSNDEQANEKNPQLPKANWGIAFFSPRGIGPKAWPNEIKKERQIRRRFVLIGQTRDGQRVWDILQATRALETYGLKKKSLRIRANNTMAGNALYASLFTDEPVQRLDLNGLPASHQDGPTFLNVLRFLDMPQAAAMAGERSQLRIYTDDMDAWSYLTETAIKANWPKKQLQLRKPSEFESQAR
ncbi:acetylxylan esterase [bacterium]|nr:acetylxylan esterase [bacterium]